MAGRDIALVPELFDIVHTGETVVRPSRVVERRYRPSNLANRFSALPLTIQ